MPRVHYHRHIIISSNAITVKPALTDVSYLEPMRYRAKDRVRPVANPSGRSVWPAEACRNTPYDVAVSRKRTLSTGYGPDGTDRKDGRGNRPEAATDRFGYREMIDVGVNLSTNPPPAPAALRARRLPLLADPARPPQTAVVRRTRHLRILYRKHGAGAARLQRQSAPSDRTSGGFFDLSVLSPILQFSWIFAIQCVPIFCPSCISILRLSSLSVCSSFRYQIIFR